MLNRQSKVQVSETIGLSTQPFCNLQMLDFQVENSRYVRTGKCGGRDSSRLADPAVVIRRKASRLAAESRRHGKFT